MFCRERKRTACLLLMLASLCAGTAGLRAEPKELREPPVRSEDREHWAFRPLTRPELPQVERTRWIVNEIDRFILAELEAAGLDPQPPADPRTLIRRVTFALTGLPPTPEEIRAYLADESPHRYEQLVDRLLASPAYGEHLAQHWLDLARFAETDGFEHDLVRPEAWRYRQWVIEALNRDLPYDEFVRLQLAGDLLEPNDPEAQLATAFCLSGPDMPDINSQEERRHHLLNEMTGTVGSVLLGLQLGCAACHDHKYDPISQADFYRLRAVFAPAVKVTANQSVSVLKQEDWRAEVSHLMVRGDWRRPGPVLVPGVPRVADPWSISLGDGGQSAEPRAQLAEWITRADHPLTSRVMVNRIWQQLFGEGLSRTPSDFGTRGERPSHPKLLDWLATQLVRDGWSLKTLQRRIVLSATYRQASRPETPEAAEDFQRALEVDPENRLLARFSRQRLTGEALRDAMLLAAGVMDPKMGGPSVRPPLPEELVATLLRGHWHESPEEDHYRRSIYVFARRNLKYPIFDVFDRPDANASCAQRSRSTTAPQSLLMFNSRFSLDMARQLAGLALREQASREEQVRLVFLRTLARQPGASELSRSLEFLEQQAARIAQEKRSVSELALPSGVPEGIEAVEAAALTDLCLALLNSNEFVYLD